MNIALLRLLRTELKRFIAPEVLAESLGSPVTDIIRDLDELKDFGFSFDRMPCLGIRYAGPARRLCPDQIEWQLRTRTVGNRITVWQRVSSTNDVAARAAACPVNDGLVVLAEEQTAGRGRRHRRWITPPDTSILMSVLLFPPESIRTVSLLTCLAAVAVADVIIDQLRIPARIKWPNDVRINGRKVCGILVEDLALQRPRRSLVGHTTFRSSASGSVRKAVVMGIGVNVNLDLGRLPLAIQRTAGSLMQFCGELLDRSELVRLIIQKLDYYYQLACSDDCDCILQRWRELADLVGTPVRVERARDTIVGYLVDLSPEKGVCLKLGPSKFLDLPAGEVISISELH